ncbi:MULTISPECIES: flagellar hook-basal body complex protein FliE [unclassified Paracoccus (in: a-proteobacteria)]|uniref:flagellar hook-basal body complex protein FliE n=1 Tax=unclassified Paracoccus (in: a-proteobacteria) TaxID=2688777 RepID=UPI0016043250|nr:MULTISPECIES: flagellar hook-basal body complex protein FliE [unclassified Paracoccus (in: a-proteobacteria)]MBB1490789.1 flagellar hook-basal body complex protein FliE [Paracoccus sp. MC1854]MBB1497368.1 flagellar hook-basal body complex protein FliE [Paracoccus sp. MC1862]QQO45861.1 flagellar hook-basal body complex protein FliE [Paracoccus sp. MC1862]
MISLTTAALQTGSRVASAYAEARAAAAPSATGAAPAMTAAARDFAAVMEAADTTAIGAMQGRSDTQALVQSIAQAQVALETAVAIRDKVVEAYQEILRMPV